MSSVNINYLLLCIIYLKCICYSIIAWKIDQIIKVLIRFTQNQRDQSFGSAHWTMKAKSISTQYQSVHSPAHEEARCQFISAFSV